MRVGVLGPLEVEQDGERVVVAGGRLRALLACLALEAGKPVTTGKLVDALWEDDLPADQVHALQSLVSRLRRALGNGSLVAPAPGGYKLDVEVDADHFEQLAAEGSAARRANDHARAARILKEALELWRGPALADLADYRFAAQAADRLDDLRLTALADRIDADLALGSGDRLVPELEALSAQYPLHERLAAQLITALFAAGRQADALAAYEKVRVRLDEELGVPPSPELQQAHMAVLTAEAAPLKAVTRTNLRAPVTSFVGRERELSQIDDMLERSRLVTLLGPGGAGKTRLAREAAARWVPRMDDGVWMVELAPVTAEAEVVPAVLGALSLREAAIPEYAGLGPRDGLARLLDVLAEREAIIVLDNCEHVIAAAAELADQLLGACPRLKIIATSREALAIDGESLVAVPPLSSDPALQLFTDRAKAARPDYEPDEFAEEICRRLDGLPLALELAAARLRTLPAKELAQRLDDRFRLLTGGSRTALPRHRTLRAVVDWSWDLLDEPERTLARRLSILSAGATAESASAVLEEDSLDLLTALAERSILQVVPDSEPTRYRMLETIREYGLERLVEAGEEEATRTAAARHFAELVARAEPRLRRPDQQQWYALLSAERENILNGLRHLGDTGDARRAVKLSVDLLWFWLLTGSQEDATTWLKFALAVPGESDPDDHTIAELVAAMDGLGHESDPEVMKEFMGTAVERLDALDDSERPLVAMAKVVLQFFTGDRERQDEAQRRGMIHPDPWVHAAVHLLRAGTAENDGDIEIMGAELARAQAEFEAVGDGWGLAMATFMESGRLMLAADLEGAEEAINDARHALMRLGPETGGAMVDLRLADLRLRRGDLDGARQYAREALERRDIGSDETAFMEGMVARIAWLSGDLEEAQRVLDDAAERIERRGPQLPQSDHGSAIVHGLCASVAAERGDFEAADRFLVTAHKSALGTEDMPVISSVAVAAALVAARRGDHAAEVELLTAAQAIRGSDDPTNPEIARLTDERGPALSQEDALAALAAAVSSGAARIGP